MLRSTTCPATRRFSGFTLIFFVVAPHSTV
jgi:hypothetical protein